MKPTLSAFLLCVPLVFALQARATVLPDACGDDKVKFDVSTQKAQPAPAPPAAGKAQIVFVETMDKPWGCLECGSPTTRFGMDSAWVGANKGNSYFTLDVAPGEHKVCADWQSVFGALKQKTGVTSFTAEAGKVYYFEAKVEFEVHQYGVGPGSNTEIDRHFKFSQLSDDEGQYRVKASALSTFKPNK
jgi:hypothetical protein